MEKMCKTSSHKLVNYIKFGTSFCRASRAWRLVALLLLSFPPTRDGVLFSKGQTAYIQEMLTSLEHAKSYHSSSK